MLDWQKVKTLDWVLIGLWVGGLVLLFATIDTHPVLGLVGGGMVVLGVLLGIVRVLWAALTDEPRPEYVEAAETLAQQTCTTCGRSCDPKRPYASMVLSIDSLDVREFDDAPSWLETGIFCRASCLKTYLDRVRTVVPSRHPEEEGAMVRAFSRSEMELR